MGGRRTRQQALEFRTWGGKRAGAGRKAVPRPGERPHRWVRKRPALTAREPVHVVLRVTREVGRLRRRSAYHAVRKAMLVAADKGVIRLVHVSIQQNHIHLLVEAADERDLARGMQGFEISAARRLNAAVARDRGRSKPRRGSVFVRRYHAEIIDSPRRARHALAYVLNNWRRHREDLAGVAQRRMPVDPYASGISFDGWDRPVPRGALPDAYEPLPVAEAASWLLTTGWRRHGPIGVGEVPGPAP
jgi:REP element-mobilizing transposase RayT